MDYNTFAELEDGRQIEVTVSYNYYAEEKCSFNNPPYSDEVEIVNVISVENYENYVELDNKINIIRYEEEIRNFIKQAIIDKKIDEYELDLINMGEL